MLGWTRLRCDIKGYLAPKILPAVLGGQSKRIAVCREIVQAFEASIEEVHMKAHELALVREITDKQAVLNIAFAKEFVIKLQLAACPDI